MSGALFKKVPEVDRAECGAALLTPKSSSRTSTNISSSTSNSIVGSAHIVARCLKFLGRCDGYETAKTTASPRHDAPPSGNRVTTRPLLPRRDNQNRFTYTPILHHPVHIAKFRNEEEHLGFLAFRNLTISELSSLFPSSLWERVIFQASEEEVFIRDAVVAVGALFSCERRLMVDAENRKTWSGLEKPPRYQFALQHHGRAIQSMRAKLSTRERSLRTMLVGCLLIVCFEAVQGNYIQSLTHAIGGHSVLQNWLASKKHSGSIVSQKEGIVSPAEDVLESDLVQAFARMDLQVMKYSVDPRATDVHQKLRLEGSDAITGMPTTFINTGEARTYLELVERRAWHFIATKQVEVFKKQRGEDKIDVIPKLLEDCDDISSGQAEEVFHSDEIARWLSAIEPFYNSIVPNSREWKAATLLQIQAQTTKIMLNSVRPDESWADPFLPEFRWIAKAGKEIFDDNLIQNGHRFSFDGGIIKPLWMIGTYCRESTVRREAIALLRKVAVKELFWDGLLHASACEAQMLIEEEGMDEDGFIPEDERFKITGGMVDGLNRIGMIRLTKMARREDGMVDEREFALPL
ncbi:uncharacterized protein PAC_06528 [Phialocephala subalpina]|uniref:Uncharacterized protein n=1 Tax=Phialocephala subalpina TaxID=576137 RepID=A0A1L7WV51_9HELO|nr:uncharacterized protein PAC_06528 [Phialocephala subalpina]